MSSDLSLPAGVTAVRHLLPDQHVTMVAWWRGSKVLAAGTRNDGVFLVDTKSGRVVNRIDAPSLASIEFSPLGKLAVGHGTLVSVWDRDVTGAAWTRNTRNVVGRVAWSARDFDLAAGQSDSLQVWSMVLHWSGPTLVHHAKVPAVAWSGDGRSLATGSFDGTISIFATNNWRLRRSFRFHDEPISSLSWFRSSWLISTSFDRTIRIQSTSPVKEIAVLEGHTAPVSHAVLLGRGRVLATKSSDEIRFWNTADWTPLGVIPERDQAHEDLFASIAANSNVLATLGDGEGGVRLWKIDLAQLIRGAVRTTRYRNAKVVLLGDSGVGKSGLAYVLNGDGYRATESNHTLRVMTLDRRTIAGPDGNRETRETILWDLPGQPDYRIIHQLHLSDTAVALIVFASLSATDPLSGIRHWVRALAHALQLEGREGGLKKFLVAARTDVGAVGIGSQRLAEVLREYALDGYFRTSAKLGDGIGSLLNTIHASIDWDSLPFVSSNAMFEEMADFIAAEKDRDLSPVDDLFRSYIARADREDTPELRNEFESCLARLQSRGLVQLLSFGSLVLLRPELRDSYTAAIVTAAKDEPDGLGSLDEEGVKKGSFGKDGDSRITDRGKEALLLLAMIEDLLSREIALREVAGDKTYLVFPSQSTRKNPDMPASEGNAFVYTFEGPVANVYATLAVRLSYSGIFRRKELWRNAITYTTVSGGLFGISLHELTEARAELTLFYDLHATVPLRFHFEEFIEAHLRRRALPGSVARRRIVVCGDCGTPISDLAAERRRAGGFDWIICNVCPGQPRLDLGDPAVLKPESQVAEMDRVADAQRDRAAAASVIEGKQATDEYDVFLCHNTQDKPAVEAIARELVSLGIRPWLDAWHVAPFTRWQAALEKALGTIKSTAIFVGPSGIGPWQNEEMQLAIDECVRRKTRIGIVLLEGVPDDFEIPPLMRSFQFVDFRKPDPIKRLIWGITGVAPSATPGVR